MDNPGTGPGVVAAIMTYNRREMLRRCIQGIRDQTIRPDEILIVDNSSTDGTAEMLSRDFSEVLVYRTPENLGCAGAMHEALRLALTLTPKYIWFFDDDVFPYPACLATLLDEMRALERERRVGALRPMIQDPQTRDVVGGGISHGALLRAEMVRSVGLPQSELFIELSDHSYKLMIRKGGYQILRVPVVLAEHPVNRPKALRDVVRQGYPVNPWRLYYAVRNRIYFSLYVQRSFGQFLRHLVITSRTVALLTLFGRPRRGVTMVIRGVVDGLLARLGRRVNPSY